MTSPQPQAPGAARASTAPPDPAQASTGELIGQLTDQLSGLGLGAGLFGGFGLVAVVGLGALVTAAVLGLASVQADLETVKQGIAR